MKDFLDYYHTAPISINQKQIMETIHNELLTYPGVECKIRFKIPFFYKNTWIAYLNPIKKNGVEFCIVRARELNSIKEVVEFKNRTMVAGISIFKLEDIDIDIDSIHFVFQEAFQLDLTTPYTFKKRKNYT